MKKPGSKTEAKSRGHSNKNKNFQEIDSLTILDNTNASIWAVDKAHNLIFGNSIFKEKWKKVLGRKILLGETAILEMLNNGEKNEWKNYYDRALKGEKFSIERKRIFEEKEIWTKYHFSPIVKETNDKIGVSVVAHDITERKQLDLEQNQLVTMLDIAPNSIMIHDFNGNLLYSNQKASELHGYSKEEFMSLSLQKLDTPESARLIPERLKLAKEKGEASFEVEHYKKDGSTFPLEVFILLTKWGDKDAVISVATDITERKNHEKALKESEDNFKTIIENSPDAIFLVDRNGNYVYANRAASDLLGYEIGEILKLNIINLGEQDVTGNRFAELLKNGKLHTEVPLKKKDGSIIDVDFNAIVLPNGLMYGSCRDLTERKKNETFLKDTQKIANLGTYKMDIISGFWESSKIMDKIFGIKGNYTKNVDGWLSIVHPDWRKIMNEYLINEVFTKKVSFNKEYKIVRKNDKEERWVHGRGRLEYDKNGKPIKMIGTIQDITDIKKIQEELTKAKEKAEESDRLKSAFLANMSHEIRTPMNGILGFTDLLKEPQLNGEEQKKFIEIIERSGKRMLNTINNIIDISKIESGQTEALNSEFNVSEILENIFHFFKPEADKKKISIQYQNNLKESEDTIQSDKEKLNAVLINLIKNAIKFCDGGTIEICCERWNDLLRFYVKDTGKGIPSNRQQAIFERFVQADIEDKEVHEGSGLGLAISKSYVELLGGKIWVESKKGKGSTFYFTIPFQPVMPLKKSPLIFGDNYQNKAKKLKILIAEDDKISEMLTKILMDKISSEMLTTKTGIETVEVCKDNPDIDLILMDIKMPLMDGYEATVKIREFNKNIIIIATTAFALAGDREKALEAGCNEYISKPIDQNLLHKLINQYFS